jgi:uncharacterized protein (UPF0261 family)
MTGRKTILLIGTLDTKGHEFSYLKTKIEGYGCGTLVADVGVMGAPTFTPDITRDQVAEAGGSSLAELVAAGDRGKAIETMMNGMSRLARDLYEKGSVDGVAGMGGSGNTVIASAAMRNLPVGVPKVIATTLAAGDTRPYLGTKDITMMNSVLDIAGLNRLSRRVLDNLAGAVCGMVTMQRDTASEERPVVAATMFGVTTPCVVRAQELIEAGGYETFVFHATGTGGRTMEDLIDGGYISAVLDVTTTEWAAEVVGGVGAAGPHRLEAAGRRGLPQVIVPGAVDMVVFIDSIPEKFAQRRFHKHNPTVMLMRTSAEENAIVGKMLAAKANEASGPTAVFLPLKGVSAMDSEGQPFYDPIADEALFGALRSNLNTDRIRLMEMDLNINDPEFSRAIATELLAMMK